MKKINSKAKIVLLFGIIILIAAVLVKYQNISTGQEDGLKGRNRGPAIEIDPDDLDFGTVVYGDVPKKEIAIKNSGNENLEIMRVSTSCGCTKAEMKDGVKIIAPGGSALMQISMNPAVHGNYSDIGEIKRVVYIRSNDKKYPETELNVSANVVKPENNAAFEIKAENGKFSLSEIRVKKGDYVELKFASADNAYEFNLDEFEVNVTFESRDPKNVVFKAEKKGEFEFHGKNADGTLSHGEIKGAFIVE